METPFVARSRPLVEDQGPLDVPSTPPVETPLPVLYLGRRRVKAMPGAIDQLVWLDLPTPDLVLVRSTDGRLILFADRRIALSDLDLALLDLDDILDGQPYPLRAA